MTRWAANRAKVLFETLRGKPTHKVLRLLSDALENAAGDAARQIAELEAEVRLHEELEPVQEKVTGLFMESRSVGYCQHCGTPYMEGDKIWWNGPGKGALCEPCSKKAGFGP